MILGDKAGVCWSGERMVTNDRTKKMGYFNRAVASGIIAYKKKNQVASGDAAEPVTVTSDEDEPTTQQQQQPSRGGRARRVSELTAQGEEFLNIYKEKNNQKDEYKRDIAKNLQTLVANTKKKMSIVIIAEKKVNSN